ncbi:S1 family peptidase [Stigmatella erecta]|uniref:Trypsin n=1 Tax=Stigmatella erecta TaxID=83460 RepID=A0A1I0JBE0_9BACT|nr:trypsin-like serine protease [Stigmatella erecta]SEU06666.1 Trypsin [Stigmatella erecta]
MMANAMTMRHCATILTLLSLTNCSVEPAPGPEASSLGENTSAIYNGWLANTGQYPEVVYVDAGNFMCTGTLISPSTVLTAAHCLDHYPAVSAVSVGFGTATTAGLHWFNASAYELHPDFDMDYLFGAVVSSHHDTALIHLTSPAPYALARLVSPAEESTYVTDNATAWVAGFGQNNMSGQPSSGVKIWGLGWVTNVKDWVIRVDAGPSAACSGDSGGPFYVSVPGAGLKQAGVLSFGTSSCETWNKYARLKLDLWWIHQQATLPCDSGFPCTQRCGDYKCDSQYESYMSCNADCYFQGCGNGMCDTAFGEYSDSCPADCYCGDGACDFTERSWGSCDADCFPPGEPLCGNGVCEQGEDRYFCEIDCH